MSSSTRFVSKEFDKFTDKTTAKMNWPGKMSNTFYDYWINSGSSDFPDYKGFEISLSPRYVKTPEIEAILIDYTLITESWLFLRNGKMTINIDDVENLVLEPHESNTDVGVGFRNACAEVGYYNISKEELLKVCQAKKLEVRVAGDSSYISLDNDISKNKHPEAKTISAGDKFLFMCRAFYGGLFEDSSFDSMVESVIPVGTENEKPAAGCFVATAAMGNYNHPTVIELRVFRDTWLVQQSWGQGFINAYYEHGPKVARIVEKSRALQVMSFMFIVQPLKLIARLVSK